MKKDFKKIFSLLMILSMLIAILYPKAFKIEIPKAKAQTLSFPVTISPSKGWGVFVGTYGDLIFTINESGIAIRIEVPRDFLPGIAENQTDFLSSTITSDYFHYSVIDGRLHYPYDPNSPYIIEIYSHNGTDFFNFTTPQYVYMKNVQAPIVAGVYNFTVYIAKNLTKFGKPNFPTIPTATLSLIVNMGPDPVSIYGYVYDSLTKEIITNTKGIVYAHLTKPPSPPVARAFIDSNGRFNLTGLSPGKTYWIDGAAGFFNKTGFAYVLTTYPSPVSAPGSISLYLDRGNKINGTINYYNYTSPFLLQPIKSISDNAFLSRLGFKHLNYTVEVLDSYGDVIASFSGTSRDDLSDEFSISIRQGIKHVGYPPIGTEYSGFGPGNYTLKAWVTGYIQERSISVVITSNGVVAQANIPLIAGGLISGNLIFLEPISLSYESPREAEQKTIGTNTGTFYGGNIVIEAFDENRDLRGLLFINGTYPNGTVKYADKAFVRFYIIGFNELYNSSYSSAWQPIYGTCKDYGLKEGYYEIKVWIKGYIQKDQVKVFVSLGKNSSINVYLIRGGAVKVTVSSWMSNPITGKIQAPTPWIFWGELIPPRLRVYFENENGEPIGYAETILKPGFPGVTETSATINYSGNDWPLWQIIHYGWNTLDDDYIDYMDYITRIPTALKEGEYRIKAFTYGYVQKIDSKVIVQKGLAMPASVYLQVGNYVEGNVVLMKNEVFDKLVENITTRVRLYSGGVFSGAQTINAFIGDGGFSFKIHGFRGIGHFFYVDFDGKRKADYGLDIGDYGVKVEEFGRIFRYWQKKDVLVSLPYLGSHAGTIFEMARMATVHGKIYGQIDELSQTVPLSWTSISTDIKEARSLDGTYRLFLPDGNYRVNITFSAPGYKTQVYEIAITDAAVIGLDVELFREFSSPSPSPSLALEIPYKPILTNSSNRYILMAELKGIKNYDGKIRYYWYSSHGKFNSTNGKIVEWIPQSINENENITITCIAYVENYGYVSKTIVLTIIPIPEFNPDKIKIILMLYTFIHIIIFYKIRILFLKRRDYSP